MWRRGPTFQQAQKQRVHGVLAILSAALIIGIGACSTTVNTPPSQANEVARANYLIDQKQYSEAIFVLDAHVKKMPDDLHARALLASAYASRAGLQVSNYTAFVHEIDKWNQIDDLLPGEDDDQWTQATAKIAFRLQVAIRAFDVLPNLTTPDALKDIENAVHVLDDGGRINGGPSIYRALLRVVEFKHDLYADDRPKFVNACQIDPAELANWLSRVTKVMTLIIDDVAYGFADPAARDRTLSISRNLDGDLERFLNEDLRPVADLGVPNLPLPKPMDVPSILKKVYGGCGS